jgi:hypothetical protein
VSGSKPSELRGGTESASVTIPAKPFEGKIQLQALELACQGLAQRARLLSRAGSVKDPTRLRRIDRMVAEALEILEEEIMSYREADRTMGAGLLLRMLSDKVGPEPGSSAVRRSFDQPPSPAHSLSLRGEGKSIPAPDLLGFLSAQRKTGVLEVATPEETFTVEFLDGDIVHAQVSRTLLEQRLGDLLVTQGAVDRLTLETVRDEWPKERLGVVLLRENYVTTDALLAALQTQVQLLFNRLFTAPVTRFCFWVGPPIHADPGMRMNAMALILEGARTFDEGSIPA